MAQNFVKRKFAQYTLTLERLVVAGHPGLSADTLEAFNQKALELDHSIEEQVNKAAQWIGIVANKQV